MSLRFRRKRVLLISIVSLFIIIYLITNRTKNPTNDEENVLNNKEKKDGKQFVEEIIRTTISTTKTIQSSSLREKIVEIDGKKFKKIDWHDYELIARENARTGYFNYLFVERLYSYFFLLGLGEGGAGVEPSAQERNSPQFSRLYRENGFNAFISNNISLDRSINDIRHPQ